jgi:ABC-type transporter Mla maintaining outer membrane lipid asymmetry ATPase subunit MlaF
VAGSSKIQRFKDSKIQRFKDAPHTAEPFLLGAGADRRRGVSDALVLDDVSVVLGGRTLIAPVSIAFAADRVHAVIGRSGAGKSVLMKAVAGLLPSSGTVRVVRAPLVFVHQDPALLDELDVEENVGFAVSRRPDLSRTEARARVDASIHALALDAVRKLAPAHLSVAVQKRVALARALALRPGVLIVDEPTTGLDPPAAAAVDEALAALLESGTTPIVITHSPRTLQRLDPDVVVVDAGRVTRAQRRAA